MRYEKYILRIARGVGRQNVTVYSGFRSFFESSGMKTAVEQMFCLQFQPETAVGIFIAELIEQGGRYGRRHRRVVETTAHYIVRLSGGCRLLLVVGLHDGGGWIF